MKNILVAAFFLFSQIGYSAEKMGEKINAKGYHIENEKFSSLILTKEEIIHLSNQDKTTYLLSMIALAQILEGAQGDAMGYQDSVIQKPKTTFLLLNKINFAFASISPAHAVWGLVASMAVDGAVWLASTQAIKLAGGFVMKKVLGRTAASVATKTAVEVESAVAATAAAKALEVGSKEAVVAAKDAVLKNLNIFKNAKEAVATAVKTKQNPAEVKRLSDLAVVAEKNAKEANGVFIMKSPDKAVASKELKEMTKSSKVWGFVKDNWINFMGGALVTKGVDTYVKESNGSSVSVSGQMNEKEIQATAAAAGASISEATPLAGKVSEAELKVGDSKQEKGKSCLFGGHPSVWKDFLTVGVKCTRPATSMSETCNKDDQFLCPTYGISLENAKDDSDFCIEKKSLDDLTVRCSQNLLAVIEKKKASVSDDKLAEHQKQLKEVIMRLESNDEMKSETETKKETKSIYAYCAADSIVQKDECKAINEVLAVLKQTKVPSILAARNVSSSKAPAETATPDSWGAEGRH